MSIASISARLGITTEEFFVRAYQKEHGILYGLGPPEERHRLWREGVANVPLYVSKYVIRQSDGHDVDLTPRPN